MDNDNHVEDVSRAVYENIRPQIYPVIEEVVLDHKHLIKVEFSGENAPYSAAGRLPDGRYTCPIILKRFGLVCDNYLVKSTFLHWGGGIYFGK